MKNFRYSLLAIASASALALSACTSSADVSDQEANADNGSDEKASVTVAMVASACLGLYPAYVAQDQGFFDDQGIEVNIEPVNGSAAVLQAIMSGQADFGTPGAVPLIHTVAEGGDVIHIANTMPSGSFSIISLAGQGIENAEDLRGKTIGVSTADGGEVSFVHALMAEVGLQEGDYEILVAGEGGQAIAGFERGDIDAFAAAPDGVATLSTAGLDVIDVTGAPPGHLFGNGLAASSELVENDPETVQAFWNAYEQAVEFGKENSDAVLETCEKYQPQELEDPEFAEAMLGAFESALEPTSAEPYGYHEPAHWETLVSDLVKDGELEEGSVEVTSLYTNEFIDGSN